MLTTGKAERTRHAGLSLVPFGAVVVAVAAGVLYALTLPSSSSSGHAVMTAVIGLWVLSVVLLVVSALLASAAPTRQRRAMAVGIALALAAVGWWVSRRLDLAWVDACDFGTGSGDRCLAGSGSAPRWVLLVWPMFGLLVGGLCAAVAGIARNADSE